MTMPGRPSACSRRSGTEPGHTAADVPREDDRLAMRFEKWQALGNDYLIIERSELPFELMGVPFPDSVNDLMRFFE